jgi:hypothetical protein
MVPSGRRTRPARPSASRSLFQGGPPNHGTPRTDNRHQPSDPRAAAAAGILFSLLLGLAITLINVSAPSNPATAGDWLTDPARRAATAVALNLVPFAGIAFLWFIGVVRDRIGQREDRFFASVFSSHRCSWAAACCLSPCCSYRPPSPAG